MLWLDQYPAINVRGLVQTIFGTRKGVSVTLLSLSERKNIADYQTSVTLFA